MGIPSTYGPIPLSGAGTIQSQTVPTSTTAVRIHNDSPYDLLVSYAQAKPNLVTTSEGDWPFVVPAMQHMSMSIPADYLQTGLGAGTIFPGFVWFLPITRTTTQALTGTVSGTSQVWVVAADALSDLPQDSYSTPWRTDLSSQPRIINIPVVAYANYSGSNIIGAANTLIKPFSGNVAVKSAGTWDGNTGIQVYLYSFAASTSAQLAGYWQLQTYNASGAAVGTPVKFFYFWLNGGTPYSYSPAFPFHIFYTPPNTGAYVNVEFYATNIGTTNMGFYYAISMDSDEVNSIPVPSIGYGYAANTYPYKTNASGALF